MRLVKITDLDDLRIAPYRDIRDRDLKTRQDSFIAEGKVVLRVLFQTTRWHVDSVLVLENRLAGLDDVLLSAPPQMPVYAATQPVMDAIAGFHIHRGILALVRRKEAAELHALIDGLPKDALVLALIGVSNHDNVGAIFRSAAAFGVDAVFLDATSCDPLYRKAVRVSVGAALKVPFAIAPSAAILGEALTRGQFEQLALTPSGATNVRDLRRSRRTALYMGSEGDGLPRDLMATMTTVRIAMAPGFDSLNVATATAIALHELANIR